MYKLVTVDLADPAEKRVFKDLVPEDKKAHLQDVCAVNGDYAAIVYKRNVSDLAGLRTRSAVSLTRHPAVRSSTRFICTSSRLGSASRVWLPTTSERCL